MDSARRNTKQKQLIADVFYSLYHPTANEVYEQVKKINVSIGRATVYRFLNRLTQDGTISKIVLDENFVVFDKNVVEHAHFYCRNCGNIKDVPFNKTLKSYAEEIKKTNNYYFESVGFEICGLCLECSKKIKGEKK